MSKQLIVDRHTTPGTPVLDPVATVKVPVYDTMADVTADLANLAVGQIVATKDTGDELAQPVDVVEEGNLHAVSSNAVAESLSYSTTEQKTGGVWLDGKPIYKKVYSARNILITGDNILGVIDANLGMGIVIGSVNITNGNIVSIGYTGTSGTVSSQITADKNLQLRLTTYYADGYDVIVFYTKTTD